MLPAIVGCFPVCPKAAGNSRPRHAPEALPEGGLYSPSSQVAGFLLGLDFHLDPRRAKAWNARLLNDANNSRRGERGQAKNGRDGWDLTDCPQGVCFHPTVGSTPISGRETRGHAPKSGGVRGIRTLDGAFGPIPS